MLNINTETLFGKSFSTHTDPSEYSCIGMAQNETFLVVGVAFDSVNNRSTIRTFKIQDVIFKADVRPRK